MVKVLWVLLLCAEVSVRIVVFTPVAIIGLVSGMFWESLSRGFELGREWFNDSLALSINPYE